MEELIPLDKLLPQLKKVQNGKTLTNVLTAIRKHVNTTNHRQAIDTIKRCNSLKQLVGCTQFDNNLRIVDLALSILGNCCMNGSVVRILVSELNILQNLLRVLDKHKKDSIQGRVYRILGNLCDAIEPIQLMHKESKLVNVTLAFLKNYSKEGRESLDVEEEDDVVFTVATVSMALRFIRKLLTVRTYQVLIEEHNVIRIVGMVLIKCSQCWNRNESDVLLIDLLKILQIITSTSYEHYNLILELRTTENGDALLKLSDIILLQPERVTKIILRLARISKNISDLPIEAIIKALIRQVELPNANGSHLLLCVSNLMDHLGFHDVIKDADIVQNLIQLLDVASIADEWSVQCCVYICQSLSKFKYNESLMQSQLSANIIPIIIKKLQVLSGKSTDQITLHLHEKKEYKPSCKRVKRDFDDTQKRDPLLDRCASPSSCSDVSSCGPFSPGATLNINEDDSDSDNYSPLCSENECEEDDKEESEETLDLIPSDTDDILPNGRQDHIELKNTLRFELCSLLKLYSCIHPMHAHMGDRRLITLLINLMFDSFINEEQNEKEYAIIKAISSARNFLIPFMTSDVISQVYEVMDTKHIDCCTHCDILQSKAEKIIDNFLLIGYSDSTKGDIAYILLAKEKSDQEMQERIAISIPYVIRNKVTLMKLLIDCGALNLLLQLLNDDRNKQLQSQSIKSICTLATINLRIKNPVKRQRTTRNQGELVKIVKYSAPQKCSNTITFHLEDGSRVQADRDELIDKSAYFNALLGGSFMESHSNEVTLKEVSHDALKCLLACLRTDYSMSSTVSVDYKLDTILEVIRLADRFLLSDLTYVLSYHVEQLISLHTVPTIYKWSIESGTNMLRIESVAFALVNDNTYTDKVELFHKLFKVGYTHELIDDVRKLISQFL